MTVLSVLIAANLCFELWGRERKEKQGVTVFKLIERKPLEMLTSSWIFLSEEIVQHSQIKSFFSLFQEKMKSKNKLVPRLLGITKESVMRVDERTKDVVQEWPLTTVKRWAASPKSFTLVSFTSRSRIQPRAASPGCYDPAPALLSLLIYLPAPPRLLAALCPE